MDNSCPVIVARFPLAGKRLPADHGYLLYSAISENMPHLHKQEWLGIEMISGIPLDSGLIALPTRNAVLRLRIPADKFGEVIPLAGKQIVVGGHRIRLGIPTARPLRASPMLYSRIVTYKNSLETGKFLETAIRDLADNIGITANLEVPEESISRTRRIITINGKKIVGFSIVARGLSDGDSIKLQSLGLGGRRSMGCGIFNPIRKPEDLAGGNYE